MALSLLPPSTAHIWGVEPGCPGWVVMHHSQPPRAESQDRIDGRESHTLGARMIMSYSRGGIEFPETNDPLSDIYSSALVYANDVKFVMQERHIFGGGNLGIEQSVSCPSISPHTEGRLDTSIFDNKNMELFLWEYKYGHRIVEPLRNPQCLCYVSALLDAYGINGLTDQRLKVRIRIVQPRAPHRSGPIREWFFIASDIRAEINKLHNNAERALSGDAICNSGPYCATCDARFTCDAALRAGVQCYESSLMPLVEELSVKDLAQRYRLICRAAEQIDALKTAYKQQVESLIRSGASVPGYTAEPTFGRLDWKENYETVVAFGNLMGVDLRKNGLLTPKQAIALGLPEELVNTYCQKNQTGWVVIPESLTKAKEIFHE